LTCEYPLRVWLHHCSTVNSLILEHFLFLVCPFFTCTE